MDYRIHPNSHGLVAITATVVGTVFVDRLATVRCNAVVTGRSRIEHIVIVGGNAKVSGLGCMSVFNEVVDDIEGSGIAFVYRIQGLLKSAFSMLLLSRWIMYPFPASHIYWVGLTVNVGVDAGIFRVRLDLLPRWLLSIPTLLAVLSCTELGYVSWQMTSSLARKKWL